MAEISKHIISEFVSLSRVEIKSKHTGLDMSWHPG